jgi:DNA-binding FrmR family transcriptional regulator
MSEESTRVTKLAPKGNWGHWARTIRAILRCKRPRLDHYLDTVPDVDNDDEVQQDEDARHLVVLYVGQELSHHVANAATTRAAWLALEQQLNEARRVRTTVLAAQVSKLTQSPSESIADYLSRAQQHMVEAQDIESATQAELLRTNLVTGLHDKYKSAFGAELIRLLEDGHQEDAEFADIREQFQNIVSRIRSMAALLLPNGIASCVSRNENDQHQVAAFQAAAERQHLPTHQQYRPQQRPQEKRDNRVCRHCHGVGHIQRNCPLWKEWVSAREQSARQGTYNGTYPQVAGSNPATFPHNQRSHTHNGTSFPEGRRF